MAEQKFFNRDISWLAFNERVLMEAGRDTVPLAERLKFLAIYSSNLDEFYRVRIPALMALSKISKGRGQPGTSPAELLSEAAEVVNGQLQTFGKILTGDILPLLKEKGYHLIYNEPVPDSLRAEVSNYFFTHVLGYLQPIDPTGNPNFFPENNKIYGLAVLQDRSTAEPQIRIINIPTEHSPRFFLTTVDKTTYIVFLEDIIRDNLQFILGENVLRMYNFKITRDAELDLTDEYEEDVAEKIEKQLAKRDYGLATRFLYDGNTPGDLLQVLVKQFSLEKANLVKGGTYHNLKDLTALPLKDPSLFYHEWKPLAAPIRTINNFLLEDILAEDLILHPPYQVYDPVVRFFNEAAADPRVEEIYTTVYRVAQQSKIANALISAAKNAKKVTVVVELKARFDESNNIKWAKRMKEAGIRIFYSPSALKVHAKVALIKRRQEGKLSLIGLLATGNLNEVTARFYTDHILLTAHQQTLVELDRLFAYLLNKKQADTQVKTRFRWLLVAGFNLKRRFIALIENEISHAKAGKAARIVIKLNNLEEKDLITALYKASEAGVRIQLLVRGICCLVPGEPGMSSNISVRRIVDRYLEHGRIFIFHNGGDELIFLGSADWMNRNIHRRIEVCFPILDEKIKRQLVDMVQLQLDDNSQAVMIGNDLKNIPLPKAVPVIQSQKEIYKLLGGAP